jgi:glycosyltransferase involved in cell wall biosynthesis
MRIGFFCDEYPPGKHGGIGSVTQDLARGLGERGAEVVVFGTYRPQVQDLGGTVEEDDQGVKVLRWRYLRGARHPALNELLNRVALRRRVSALLKRHPLDLIETHESTGWFPWGAPKRVPLVTRLHGGVVYFGHELNRRYSRLQGRFERSQVRRSSAVVGVSRYVAEATLRHMGLDRPYEVIYNSVGRAFSDPRRAELPAPGSAGDRAGYVLYFGSVLPKKGLESLVKAADLVFGEVPGVRLVVAGKNVHVKDGQPYESYLRGLVEEGHQARVEFVGHVDRERVLPGLIAGAELCVFPSHAEAFALAPMEAMAMGKAVVYSRYGSGPELIRDGQDGFLVDPADVGSLAGCIGRLLRDGGLRERVGRQGRAAIEERFGYWRWIDRNLELYSRLVAPGAE